MSRSPVYKDVRSWVLGRIEGHHARRSDSLPTKAIEHPPQYLRATDYDVRQALRELRDEGFIHSHSGRWYLTNRKPTP